MAEPIVTKTKQRSLHYGDIILLGFDYKQQCE